MKVEFSKNQNVYVNPPNVTSGSYMSCTPSNYFDYYIASKFTEEIFEVKYGQDWFIKIFQKHIFSLQTFQSS